MCKNVFLTQKYAFVWFVWDRLESCLYFAMHEIHRNANVSSGPGNSVFHSISFHLLFHFQFSFNLSSCYIHICFSFNNGTTNKALLFAIQIVATVNKKYGSQRLKKKEKRQKKQTKKNEIISKRFRYAIPDNGKRNLKRNVHSNRVYVKYGIQRRFVYRYFDIVNPTGIF